MFVIGLAVVLAVVHRHVVGERPLRLLPVRPKSGPASRPGASVAHASAQAGAWAATTARSRTPSWTAADRGGDPASSSGMWRAERTRREAVLATDTEVVTDPHEAVLRDERVGRTHRDARRVRTAIALQRTAVSPGDSPRPIGWPLLQTPHRDVPYRALRSN